MDEEEFVIHSTHTVKLALDIAKAKKENLMMEQGGNWFLIEHVVKHKNHIEIICDKQSFNVNVGEKIKTVVVKPEDFNQSIVVEYIMACHLQKYITDAMLKNEYVMFMWRNNWIRAKQKVEETRGNQFRVKAVNGDVVFDRLNIVPVYTVREPLDIEPIKKTLERFVIQERMSYLELDTLAITKREAFLFKAVSQLLAEVERLKKGSSNE